MAAPGGAEGEGPARAAVGRGGAGREVSREALRKRPSAARWGCVGARVGGVGWAPLGSARPRCTVPKAEVLSPQQGVVVGQQ